MSIIRRESVHGRAHCAAVHRPFHLLTCLSLSFPFPLLRVRNLWLGRRVQVNEDALGIDASLRVETHALVHEFEPLCLDRRGILRTLAHPAEPVQRAISADDTVSGHRIASVRVGAHELADGTRGCRRGFGDIPVSGDAASRNGSDERIN